MENRCFRLRDGFLNSIMCRIDRGRAVMPTKAMTRRIRRLIPTNANPDIVACAHVRHDLVNLMFIEPIMMEPNNQGVAIGSRVVHRQEEAAGLAEWAKVRIHQRGS